MSAAIPVAAMRARQPGQEPAAPSPMTASPDGLTPTPTAPAHTGPGRSGRAGGMSLQTWAAATDRKELS